MELRARLRWTFPLAFAEVVSGDGEQVFRERIDLTDTEAFGGREIVVPVDLRGRTWARLEVWDVASNGAFTQPDTEQQAVLYLMSLWPRCCPKMGLAIIEGDHLVLTRLHRSQRRDAKGKTIREVTTETITATLEQVLAPYHLEVLLQKEIGLMTFLNLIAQLQSFGPRVLMYDLMPALFLVTVASLCFFLLCGLLGKWAARYLANRLAVAA